jgi:hypothetical protein
MLNLPFFKSMFKRASLSKIENIIAFNSCFRGLNFHASYFILVIVHDFKALSLIKICLNLLYLKVNIKKHAS